MYEGDHPACVAIPPLVATGETPPPPTPTLCSQQVVFEDDHLACVCKPQNMPVDLAKAATPRTTLQQCLLHVLQPSAALGALWHPRYVSWRAAGRARAGRRPCSQRPFPCIEGRQAQHLPLFGGPVAQAGALAGRLCRHRRRTGTIPPTGPALEVNRGG